MRGPIPPASALNWETSYAQLASRVSSLSMFFSELLESSDLPSDLTLQLKETKNRCDDLVVVCETSKSAVSDYVVHALDRLDEVPSLLEQPSKLGRRLRAVRADIGDIQERLSGQDRACSDAESSIKQLILLLKDYASKAQQDKTNQQIGAVFAGVMCFGLAAYAIPAMLAGGSAASGAAAVGSSALAAESSVAAVTAAGAAAAAEGAAAFAAGAMTAEAAAAMGAAAAVTEGAVAALSTEAAIAGAAMAGASAVALKQGAKTCDDLISRLNLQMDDLECKRLGVKEAESTCQDLLKQVALVSRDYADAEDAFSESDLKDLMSFVRDAKKRLTGLMEELSTSDSQLVTSNLT